jgi:hypothetical protein
MLIVMLFAWLYVEYAAATGYLVAGWSQAGDYCDYPAGLVGYK